MKPIKLPKLVGFAASGPGAGKDTTFKYLKASGLPVENIKFATKLEQEVYQQFQGMHPKDLDWIRNDPQAKDHPFHFLSVSSIEPSSYNRGYKTWLREKLLFDGLDDPRSMRWHLIEYGTNYVRKYLGKDSYWLDEGMAAAQLTHTRGSLPIITDVRFPNEAEAIKDAGGILVYLNSPWSPNTNGGIADGLIAPEDCHLVIDTIHGNPSYAADYLLAYFKKGHTHERT